jgi:hypothetical protein
METGGGGDDVGGVRYYYYHSKESIKNLPSYPDKASRAAWKRQFPGHPGSKFWTARKILSDFFRSRLFWHIFFHSSEYNHNFGGRTAGKTVGGKFQSWVLDENLSGYLFTEHNPSLN